MLSFILYNMQHIIQHTLALLTGASPAVTACTRNQDWQTYPDRRHLSLSDAQLTLSEQVIPDFLEAEPITLICQQRNITWTLDLGMPSSNLKTCGCGQFLQPCVTGHNIESPDESVSSVCRQTRQRPVSETVHSTAMSTSQRPVSETVHSVATSTSQRPVSETVHSAAMSTSLNFRQSTHKPHDH